ncbi:hypothetical protein Tco_0081916, partial [Tanacetum coccineum]
EADTPPRKRLLLTAPRLGCEVGESSVAAAARQPGPTMARKVDCSYVETRVRDTERRMMAALEVVNLSVSYQVDVCRRESSEFYSWHPDALKNRVVVRSKIEVLRRERLAYEQESMETRQALARSEAYRRALEAWITVLLFYHIVAILYSLLSFYGLLPANRRYRSFILISYPALMDQGVAAAMAEAEASRVRNGYNINGSGPRPAQAIRECSYSEFLKCKPLD